MEEISDRVLRNIKGIKPSRYLEILKERKEAEENENEDESEDED